MESIADVLIITHAGPTVGGGHASRCFALAEGFASLGVSVKWLVNEYAAGMLARRGVNEEYVVVEDNPFAEHILPSALYQTGAKSRICVVDSYEASPLFLAEVRATCKTALIDDCRTRPAEQDCDILLNYNLNATSLGYETGCAKLLLGPEYALLRSDFWELAPGGGERILIIPGASDPLNTGAQFAAWWGEGWPKAELVLGPLVSSSVAENLGGAAGPFRNLSVARDPADLPGRMAGARAVLCTSSVISYEALSLCKPLAVFQTAENQIGIGREIARLGLGVNLGPWGDWGASELRQALENLSPVQKQAVNPRGAVHAAKALLKESA